MSFYHSQDRRSPIPTEEEYIRREESIERFHEKRLRRLDMEFEYPPDACGNCGQTDVKLFESPDGTWRGCDDCVDQAYKAESAKLAAAARLTPAEAAAFDAFTRKPVERVQMRFDATAIQAIATTMFIQAGRDGFIEWNGGGGK
jgi:hypothetical protein